MRCFISSCWSNSVSNANDQAMLKESDIVFIWGASSGVGSFGLQIAKSFGCRRSNSDRGIKRK